MKSFRPDIQATLAFSVPAGQAATARPERLAQAYAPVLRWVMGASACYYALIVIAHMLAETGWTRDTLVLLASGSAILPALLWLRLRQPAKLSLGRIETFAAIVYAIFVINVLVHQAIAFRPERLVYFVFMAMVFGITAPSVRVAHGAIAVALACMAVLGLRMGPAFLDMYAFVGLAGGFAAVGMSTIVRGMVSREIEARLLSEDFLLEARSAARARSAFLATISHEVRTPLNGVLGMAQAIQRDALPRREADRLDILQREGEDLGRLLDDILDIVSLEAKDVSLDPTAFALAEFAQGLERLYAPVARDKGVRLVFDARDDGAASGACVADARRLRQISANIIHNAIKFTPGGGTVRVSIAAGPTDLVLRVDDTGVGIPFASQARIFEPFAQADDGITRGAGGAGLGLAICRQLIDLMGGEIALLSEPQGGTRVTVRTPLERRAQAPATDIPWVARRHALVVDDNATNRLVLRSLLEGVDLECAIAENGQAAVRACETLRPDLILMDINMPGMDGVDATRAIRAREAREGRSRTPIIAVTANVLPEDLARYAAAGMDDVVAKPVALEALLTALQRAGPPPAC